MAMFNYVKLPEGIGHQQAMWQTQLAKHHPLSAPPRAPGGVITLNSISRTKEAPETSVPALGGWKWLEKGFGGNWDVHCFTCLVIFREDFLDGS